MKKGFLGLIMLFLLLIIAACGDENAGDYVEMSPLGNSLELREKAKNLPYQLKDERLEYTIRYPENWGNPENYGDSAMILYRLDEKGEPEGPNFIISHADYSYFLAFKSASSFRHEIENSLKKRRDSGTVNIIRVEDIRWHFGQGFYLEYMAETNGVPVHLEQVYLYDKKRKRAIILTVASEEKKWDMIRADAKLIFYSFDFIE